MTPIFAHVQKSDGTVKQLNLSAIIEMVPDHNAGTTTLYFANNCLSNGQAFNVAPSEITSAIDSPEKDDDGFVDLLPPEPEPVEEEEAEEAETEEADD
jgi:hypothetical protein